MLKYQLNAAIYQKKSLDVKLRKRFQNTLSVAYAGGKLKIRFQGRMQRGDNHEEERLLLCERIIRKAKVLTEKRHTLRNILLPNVLSLMSFYLTGKVLI